MEADEPQADAAVREIREELGLVISPRQCVWSYAFDDSPLTLWGWTAILVDGTLDPDPREVCEILWLTGREAAEHPDGLPTNPHFVAALEKSLNG